MYSLLVCLEYIVSITLLIMALSLFKNNISKPVQYIQFTLVTMFLLNAGYLMELQCTTLEGAVTATRTEYCGSVFISTFMVFIVMEYFNIRMPRVIRFTMVSLNVVFLAFLFTNDYHRLFFEDIRYEESGFYPHAVFSAGIVRNVFAYYTIFLGVFMIIIVTCFFVHGKRGGRKIPVYFVITMMLPICSVVLHLIGIMEVIDLSPLIIGLSGICMYIFLRNDMIFEVVNVAAHMVMDNMQDAFIVMDTQMKLLDLNKSARLLFPELCDETSNTRYVPEKSDVLRGIINEKPKDIITIGDRYYYTKISEIMHNHILEGYCLHLSDRTDYKRYTDDLIRRSIEAEEDSAAKSNLLASTSHDIRTPINAIIGMNELILRNCKDRDILDYASEIKNSGNYLLTLVNDVLDMSKIEAGRMSIIEVEYNTADMYNGIISMNGIIAKEKNIAFRYNIAGDIPLRLLGDEVRIRQILNNILSNAVKYTEEGYVEFSVSVADRNESEVTLHYEIKDSGIGIKEEDMSKILEPYRRVDEVRNRNLQGTGLGMSIVINLLNMMNSRLNVESVYSRGSSFSFDLVQRTAGDSIIGNYDEYRKRRLSSGRDDKVYIKVPGAKVLIVDDSRINIMVLKNILKMTEVIIDTALSGEECLDKVRHNIYNIIFMDHMMPDMDGVETVSRLRAMEDNMSKEAAVIVLTANAVSGAESMYKSLGFDDYMPKPIDFERLEKLLTEYLPMELVVENNKER